MPASVRTSARPVTSSRLPAPRRRVTGRDRSWLRPAPVPRPDARALPGAPALDDEARTASFGGTEVRFSDLEYAVLALLVAHPHVMLTHDEIALRAWGRPAAGDRVTSAVKRVRARMREAGADAEQVVTIHTLGYRWDPSAPPAVEARSA